MIPKEKLQKVLDGSVDQKKVFWTSFCIQYGDEPWAWTSGNFVSPHEQYFIASTTKLFTTAVILGLRHKKKIGLDDAISEYIDKSVLEGIHTLRGTDSSGKITIRHLLAHTSWIPDYFQKKWNDGKSLEQDLVTGKDQFWSFEDCIERSKSMKPLFFPGEKGKAHYSDTNFQLLGKIIENITGESLESNYTEYIYAPLGLKDTYLYSEPTDSRPKNLYYKNNELIVPKAMTSFGADGSIVSNSFDLNTFLRGFFGGKLFPKEYIAELQEWNPIFFPMQSWVGIHRFKLPWIFNPFGSIPEFIWHSGLSGTVAYYAPKYNIFITGTVNQIAYPDTSFKVMIKIVQSLMKH